MSDAMSDYFKQERLTKEAKEILRQYKLATREEKQDLEKRIQQKYKRTPSELQKYLNA